jgi:hypothetical protein
MNAFAKIKYKSLKIIIVQIILVKKETKIITAYLAQKYISKLFQKQWLV